MVKTFDLPLRDGSRHVFDGRLLGSGSSARADKSRWFEVAIYEDVRGQYVLHTAGMSTVNGEEPWYRLITSESAFEIVDRLIVHHAGKIYVPSQSMRALTAAAQYDDNFLEALRELPTMIRARHAGEAHVA